MQTAAGSGGVGGGGGNMSVIENGSSTSNGVMLLTNGCGSEIDRGEETSSRHCKRGKVLNVTDREIICLIGQHLREMGLQ